MTNQKSSLPSGPTEQGNNLLALFKMLGFFLLLSLNIFLPIGTSFAIAFSCDGNSNYWFCGAPIPIALLLLTLFSLVVSIILLFRQRYLDAMGLMAIQILVNFFIIFIITASV